MKELLYLLVTYLLFLRVPPAAAQQPAATGLPATDYLLTTAGDTVRGTVRLPQFVTQSGVGFRPAGGGPATTYRPGSIRGFGMRDGRRFVSRRVVLQHLRPGTATYRDSVPVFLQCLVLGPATLYRLDYNRDETATAMTYSRLESSFWLLSVVGGPLVLQQESYQPLLQAALGSCAAAAAAVRRSRFEEAALRAVVALYNQCYPHQPGQAVVPTGPVVNYQTGWSLLGGVALQHLYYNDDPRLSAAATTANLGWTAGILLHTAPAESRWSVGTGLQYARRQSSATNTLVVPAGFSNAGEQLSFHSRLQVHSLQAPLWAQHRLGTGPAGFYVRGGAAPGIFFRNTSSFEVAASVVDPAAFRRQLYVTRQDPLPRLSTSTTVSVGGLGALGFRMRLGNRWGLLEVAGELGRELNGHELGPLFYRSLGLRAGVDL